MSIERVRAFMRERNMEEKILEFEVSSATVELAAQAVGVEPARIAKTLSFMVDGSPILIVAAGDAKVDNARFKALFHTKAKMLTPDEAVTLIGHAVGGVCPFALNENVTVYLDESLRRFTTVFPAAGSSNSAIELTMHELEALSGGTWIDACKGWREEAEGRDGGGTLGELFLEKKSSPRPPQKNRLWGKEKWFFCAFPVVGNAQRVMCVQDCDVLHFL